MQVGRDPIGPVGFDRAQCIYDLADRHVAVDRAHPTPFERRRETIDMDRAQVADAGQLQSFVGKPGEEVTIDLDILLDDAGRSEEHTSELQSLMRISYAVFCLKKKKLARNDHSTAPLMRVERQTYKR